MKNTLIVAIVAVSVLAVTIATAGAVATTGSVTGGGSGAFPAPFGPLAGDRLSVVLTARTLPTGTISGRFQLVHRGKDGGLWPSSRAGSIASSSRAGRFRRPAPSPRASCPRPQGFDPTGQTAAITIVDQGNSDVAGVDLSFFGTPHAIAPCQNVPLYLAIDQGDFTVSP